MRPEVGRSSFASTSALFIPLIEQCFRWLLSDVMYDVGQVPSRTGPRSALGVAHAEGEQALGGRDASDGGPVLREPVRPILCGIAGDPLGHLVHVV